MTVLARRRDIGALETDLHDVGDEIGTPIAWEAVAAAVADVFPASPLGSTGDVATFLAQQYLDYLKGLGLVDPTQISVEDLDAVPRAAAVVGSLMGDTIGPAIERALARRPGVVGSPRAPTKSEWLRDGWHLWQTFDLADHAPATPETWFEIKWNSAQWSAGFGPTVSRDPQKTCWPK